MYRLITSYLRNRKQRVKIGNAKGAWLGLAKCSAQSSIFGPFCYNVFINDLMYIKHKNIDIYNYADEYTLVCSGYDYEEIKQEIIVSVNEIIAWFERNHMQVNPDKFQCIVLGNVNNLGTLQIHGDTVILTNKVKLLGLDIDNKLNFKYHISKICQKAGRQVNVLSRLSRVLDKSKNCFYIILY